jgi:hypothetical protein
MWGIVATLIPFTHLNDMISCAVLTALSLTDTSLILLWHPSRNEESPWLAESLMGAFHLASLVAGVFLSHFLNLYIGRVVAGTAVLAGVACVMCLILFCPKAAVFGGSQRFNGSSNEGYFRTPCVPVLPCMGIFLNWYLIAQLEIVGIALHLGFLAVTLLYYFSYAVNHSVGNNGGWLTPSEESEKYNSIAGMISLEVTQL